MSCDCLCYFISVFLAVPWFSLQCVIVVFPDHTHVCLFLIKLYLENLVQPFNAESNTIVIKPVRGIDDAIAKCVYLQICKKK